MSLDISFNIAGLVIGILGLGTFQMLIFVIRSLLPHHRLASLEKDYTAAVNLFECSLAEDLLFDREVIRIRETLESIRASMNLLHNEAIGLRSVWQQLSAIFRTMSSELGELCDRIHEVRVVLASSSQNGRARLQETGRRYRPCIRPSTTTSSNARSSRMTYVMPMGSQSSPSDVLDRSAGSDIVPNQPRCLDAPPSGSSNHSTSSLPSTQPPARRDSTHSTVSTADTMVDLEASDITKSSADQATPSHTSGTSLNPQTLPILDRSDTLSAANSLRKYCADLVDHVDSIQSFLSLPSSRLDPDVDIDGLSEGLSASKAHLASLSRFWSRPETGLLLPS
ncbi:hypothetical protein QCA50_004849 [Cerrena zonata]|uniref:Fungal N-terminal domain-containing protein n=1 Tax=Cerrena zonata TaxID=2478898 RepID=A0AAW0GQE7_9APHY